MIKEIFTKIVFVFICTVFVSSKVNGYVYECFSEGLTSVHVLIVNPEENLIIPVRALGENVRQETVKTLADRHRAVAAINGGFWKSNGEPAGALKIDHQWLGTPVKPRGVIGWSVVNHIALFDQILTNYSLEECFGDNQIEVVPAMNPASTTPEEWNALEHIVGGTPLLVHNGCLVEDFSSEQTLDSFLVNPHPRTAVGTKDNGDWVFVVVDGGMTMAELSQFMLDQGCVEALNLCGGGSSTMVLEGKVINETCGRVEEDGKFVNAVSDVILILPFTK